MSADPIFEIDGVILEMLLHSSDQVALLVEAQDAPSSGSQ